MHNRTLSYRSTIAHIIIRLSLVHYADIGRCEFYVKIQTIFLKQWKSFVKLFIVDYDIGCVNTQS